MTGFGDEERFVDALLKELAPRRPDAREFALSRRVLLAKTQSGIDVDVALGALPFEERTVARATRWHFRDDVTFTTCSAEDLIVHKAFAGRDLDWGDVERVLIRQHGRLNLEQVRLELKPLLELKGEMPRRTLSSKLSTAFESNHAFSASKSSKRRGRSVRFFRSSTRAKGLVNHCDIISTSSLLFCG